MTLAMDDLHTLARTLMIHVMPGQVSMCWPEHRLITIGPEHRDNPFVLAHEIAHAAHGGRGSRVMASYRPGGLGRLATRCEENIADTVAHMLTGGHREGNQWAPVSGLAAHYVRVHAEDCYARLMEAYKRRDNSL